MARHNKVFNFQVRKSDISSCLPTSLRKISMFSKVQNTQPVSNCVQINKLSKTFSHYTKSITFCLGWFQFSDFLPINKNDMYQNIRIRYV